MNVRFTRTATEMTLEVFSLGGDPVTFQFQPALSLRADVLSVELNGRSLPFQLKPNESDQHLLTQFIPSPGLNTLRVRTRHDFVVSYTSDLPPLGKQSEGLRILSESWNPPRTQLTLKLEGFSGVSYFLSVFNKKEIINASGNILKSAHDSDTVGFVLDPSDQAVAHGTLVFDFAPKSEEKSKAR